MLYQADRHTPLEINKWDEAKARETIKEIYEYTLESFNALTYWPTDEKEDANIKVNKTFYFGASGTLWALDVISNFLKTTLTLDKHDLIKSIHSDYIAKPDTNDVVPSLFLGELGILLVNYKFNPTKALEEKIVQVIESNIENPTLEALWAAPGTMLGASFLYEWTKRDEFLDLFKKNSEFLIKKLKEAPGPIWMQDLYGSEREIVGAGHGYLGNVYSILKHLEILDIENQEYILKHIEKTLVDLAIIEDGNANWPAVLGSDKEPLVQWCHGAPGILTSLKYFPKNRSEAVEDLLIKAGNLVYEAGPLTKGVGLCHGTDGNAYAFLMLYKRTGDELWLNRARDFAMHALSQRNGRFTVFTGGVGLAVFLISLLNEDDRFPLLDWL